MAEQKPFNNSAAFHGQIQVSGDKRAELNFAALAIAIKAGASICQHCLQPYEVKEREFAYIVQFRSILCIPDSAPMPMVCDLCFEKAIATYNRRVTVPGTNNAGPPNLVIQHLGS